MSVDHEMDVFLRETMAGESPQLSPGFDARVLRRVRPRRLTSTGRVVLVGYGAAAALVTSWCLYAVDPLALAMAVVVGIPVAAGTRAYAHRLVG